MEIASQRVDKGDLLHEDCQFHRKIQRASEKPLGSPCILPSPHTMPLLPSRAEDASSFVLSIVWASLCSMSTDMLDKGGVWGIQNLNFDWLTRWWH